MECGVLDCKLYGKRTNLAFCLSQFFSSIVTPVYASFNRSDFEVWNNGYIWKISYLEYSVFWMWMRDLLVSN
jgi:hypothetical protein